MKNIINAQHVIRFIHNILTFFVVSVTIRKPTFDTSKVFCL